MLFTKGSKLVFMGDSITDCGRGRPLGEGFGGQGSGYPFFVNTILQATAPRQRLRVVNMGTSGDTIRMLAARWQADAIDLAPDYVSVMIGINDVWRTIDNPLIPEYAVPLDEYERTYRRLVAETAPRVKKMILLAPFILGLDKSDAFRVQLDKFGDVARRLAAEHNCLFIDIQAMFDRYLAENGVHPMTLAADRVHPNATGQYLIALEFLRACQ